MKLVITILCMLPVISFGQTKTEEKNVMKKFVGFYNAGSVDSICTLFPVRTEFPCFWSTVDSKSTFEEYGKINSYKFIGVDPVDKVTVFKVHFGKKGTKALSFDLINHKFSNFRFDTSSEEIGLMMKESE